MDSNQYILVEKLRNKLQNFNIKDSQDEIIGKVQDLILDGNQQLNLVVNKITNQTSGLVLLSSKLIQKVDSSSKSVVVSLSKAEMEDLPKYSNKQMSPQEPLGDENNLQKINEQAIHENIQTDLNPVEIPLYESINVEPEALKESIDESIQTDLNVIETPFYESITVEPEKVNNFEAPEVLEEEIVRLLEERLIIDRSRHKIGEVIVRKEIQTRMVQVPVMREKLIIEQVGVENKQLAEINLGEDEIFGIDLKQPQITAVNWETISQPNVIAKLDNEISVRGEFDSPKIVSLLLNAIALERQHGCKKVRLEIIVEDEKHQQTYQEWFNRCSKDGKINPEVT